MQTCPGFFLKSLLECPGNLLKICSVKFADSLCYLLLLLSFFLAGRVFSPALRPYVIGPMRSPDIQNFLRGLSKHQERKIS